jgi:hypothetical protein
MWRGTKTWNFPALGLAKRYTYQCGHSSLSACAEVLWSKSAENADFDSKWSGATEIKAMRGLGTDEKRDMGCR